ncbi:hypothetical protein ABZ897_15335 [Nonomuraea sp. NPDC046802]|uniref:tetratricopeptide repeat protein n=1 Tax=Nonomuraea sp. NPDC046802 TaxID=3154919 RepID=UPI0033FC4A89
MDTPPHRLGLERVVEVYSGHDDLVGVTGSGYVIGADLVLSSGDVVDPGAPCQVRAPWSGRWSPAEQVWRGRGGTGAVLLRVPDSPWAELPGVGHVRWARVADDVRFRLRCVARGFPRAEQRAGFRDAQTLAGLVDAPTSAVSKALAVTVLTPDTPVSLWQGMSGAVLLAEPTRQLIGVIAAGRDGHAQRRLDAVPVTALLSDQRFRELTGVPPGTLETVAEGDPAALLPALAVPARERLPQDGPDWTLLMPRHAVVPFVGRDEELTRLREWAAEPAALSIAVLTGRGGTGKTRLAGELCEELAEAGWESGFLPLDAACGPLADPAATLDALRPTLLVVDQAEPSAPLVGELVRRLAKHRHNPRVRLLLLAREPAESEWWRRLDTAAGGWLRRLNSTTVQLNAHPLTLEERRQHALAAMKAFAPSRAALPEPPPLDDPEYGLPLRVHLAALVRLRDGDERSHDELVGRFLAREQDQWAQIWPGGRPDQATARQAAALLTLTAPTTAELPGLLTAVPGLSSPGGLNGRVLDVAAWLGRIFPGGERPAPLGPDVVAERLLAETEGLETLVLAVHDHEGRTTRHLVRLLDVLRLCADSERVRSALRSLVVSRIASLVAQAAAAPATRLGDVLNAALGLFADDRRIAAAVAALPVRRDTRLGLRALDVTLGELAVRHLRASDRPMALAGALTTLSGRLAAVGRVGEAVVTATEAVEIFAAAPPYEEAVGRAEALYDLGACLLLAGEASRALKPAQEAAARFRILAEEDARYAERAARAHHNLACALMEAGRTHEAVTAFETAGGNPSFATTLADVLSMTPQPARKPPFDAPDTTRPPTPFTQPDPLIRNPGASAPFEDPDTTRPPTPFTQPDPLTGNLGAGLNATRPSPPFGEPGGGVLPKPLAPFEEADDVALLELGACLAGAAARAVRFAAPTDRDLAHRLRLLASWLHEHGRAADALAPAAEAVVRLRALAPEEPELRFMLAEATALLSRLHADLDDLDAAVRSAAESVRDLRALVTLDPAEHRPRLAGRLLDLGELLLVDDRPEQALDPLQEAMSAAGEPRTQARARHLLGLCLDELGRAADARAHLEVAAELYEGAGYARHLAEVRARLGRSQGRERSEEPHEIPAALDEEEAAAREESVLEEGQAAGPGLHAQLLELRPLPGTDALRTLIDGLSTYLADMSGDAEPAVLLPPLTAFTEALERQVPLSADFDLYDRYARCLTRFGTAATRAGDTKSAVLGAKLAVHVYRGLAALSPDYRGRLGLALAALAKLDRADLAALEQAVDLLGDESRELASALGVYAVELLERGRAVEALAHCERAADLCDELDDPAVAATTYARLGSSLALLDRPQAALEAVTWSLAELERAKERGQELPAVRAQAIQVKGQVLRTLGRKQEALAQLTEALRIHTRLRNPQAAAEVAAVLADDLLAGGRPEEAAEYAVIATTGHPEGTVKHALAVQRLARCHMMLGALAKAHTLVEELIPLARRWPDDLTYRAILADSLAQSSELLPLLRLDGGTEAEARAREAIAIYDELLTSGMNAQALHTSRAGACLTLASALRMRGLAADAVKPLREAVAALERYAPGSPPLSGLLARAMLMLGDALMEAGRALEASLVFHRGTQVTRDAPTRAVAHARLGFCQRELGRDDAAEAALRVSADLLRDLVTDDRDEGLADLLRDVLRALAEPPQASPRDSTVRRAQR